MNIATEILIILAIILINAVFVLAEMSVAASRKVRLQERVNDGDRRAATALKLIEHPNLFLATVQIGITLVGVFLGAVGGARLAVPLSELLRSVPAIAAYADALALGIVV
ncbi:MAG TPA: CNNM domain-containing protein, partial [Anaerolineales bacterium]|nr:CNNM domain-containing protein [Anaerolineales bacterium]